MKRFISLTFAFFIILLATETDAQSGLYRNVSQPANNNKLLTPQRFDQVISPHRNITLAGRWPYGPCEAVFIKGDYAYIGNGAVMNILDVSNPLSPVKVSEIETQGVVYDISVSGKYAYIANGRAGLRIIDVSDPSNPTEVACHTGGHTSKVCVQRNLAVINMDIHIKILDVFHPSSPQVLKSIYMGENIVDLDIQIISPYRQILYVANFTRGFRVFDITKPEIAFEIDCIEEVNPIYHSTILGDYAYVVGYSYLYIIDVSNPEDIQLISAFQCSHGMEEISVFDGYAYITDVYYGGVWIIDVGKPDEPNLVTYFKGENSGSGWGIHIKDQYAYVACGSAGLQVLDVSMPEKPIEVSSFKTGVFFRDIVVLNDYAYILGGSTLHIFDLNNLGQPKELGHIGIDGGNSTDISVIGNYAYYVCRDGLWIIDVSNVYKPTVVSVYKTGNVACSIYVKKNYVYLGCRDGFRIVDVSIKSNPKELSFIETEMIGDVYISNDYAYLAIKSGIQIFNISIPVNPVIVTELNITPEDWIDVIYVSGTIAYVTSYSDGLIIIDISDPESPVEIGSFNEGLIGTNNVSVLDNFAYITDNNGLHIIDIANLSFPTEVGYFSTSSRGLFVSGNLAYVATRAKGFYILRNDLSTGDQSIPEYILLNQNYPNPFNSETIIRFDLPVPERVTLRIYDIRGQEVKKLVNGVLFNSGTHKISMNSKNITNGVYFYQIQAGDFIETKKLLLVK